MNMEEFLAKAVSDKRKAKEEAERSVSSEELEVQKAVVEDLAADKARLDEILLEREGKIRALEESEAALRRETAALDEKRRTAEEAKAKLEGEISALKSRLAAVESQLEAVQEANFEAQSRNPNSLALLDREVDLPDRFPGETRDHVIEVIREARDRAEAEGRVRRAQLLEGVLVANEPGGILAERREELKKLFAESGNILTGEVIAALKEAGISHKNGEEYLLPSEILLRTY